MHHGSSELLIVFVYAGKWIGMVHYTFLNELKSFFHAQIKEVVITLVRVLRLSIGAILFFRPSIFIMS